MKIQAIPSNGQIQQAKLRLDDQDFSKLLRQMTAAQEAEALKQACKEMEAIFLRQVFQEMKSTVHKSDLIPRSPGSEIFEDMYYDAVADEAATGQGMGLAKQLYDQLSRSIKER